MKKILVISSLLAGAFATPSFATPTELDKKTVASKAYVDTKQDMIPAANENYQSVLVDTDTDGEVGKLRLLTEELMEDENENFSSWGTNDSEMATAGAIFRELRNNWQPQILAGTAGNVMTYTGNAGTVGSVAVSSTEDYNQQNELTNGSNLANVQLVSTKQNKMTCAGWDSETHTDEHCWLWSIE